MSGVPLDWKTISIVTVAWLLTYTIHSTLLLSATWLITRRRSSRSNLLKDMLWKVSLMGGLLTATFQVSSGVTPLTGHWDLSTSRIVIPFTAGVNRSITISLDGTRGRLGPVDPQATPRPGQYPVPEVFRRAMAALPTDGTSPLRSGWPGLLFLLWLAGTLVAGIRLGLALHRLNRDLGERSEITNGPLPQILTKLCRAAEIQQKIRLTCSLNLLSPIALNSNEVCLPSAALTGLKPEQQECMLAHELAHVIRRDPLWLKLCALLETVFFFQPLNRLGRQQLQETAEYLCDDWAVEHLGNSLNLARCLAEVATWIAAPSSPTSICGLAGSTSPFLRRARRLLDDSQPVNEERPQRWWNLFALGLLVGVGTFAPGVASRDTGGAWAVLSGGKPAGTIHLASITPFTVKMEGRNRVGVFSLVVDGNGAPVPNATITGAVTLPSGEQFTMFGPTDHDGISFASDFADLPGVYTFTLVSISKPGWVYDPAANAPTSITLAVP